MQYDNETTQLLLQMHKDGLSVEQIATELDRPERSIIAKLSSLGVYQKKTYLNKQGNVPVKKEELISRIAKLLAVNQELLDSLEKVNKGVLVLLEKRLTLVEQS